MYNFIKIAGLLVTVLTIVYIYRLTDCFVRLRSFSWWCRLPCFVCLYFAGIMVIQPEDPVNLAGLLADVLVISLLFYQGKLVIRISLAIILFILIVNINFFTQDIFGRIYFNYYRDDQLANNLLFAAGQFIRLPIWWGIYRLLHKKAVLAAQLLTDRMWLVMDCVLMASLIGSITLISALKMGNESILSYPAAIASLLAGIGCIYMAAEVASGLRAAAEVENLQTRHSYYEEVEQNQGYIRRLKHDMNNQLGTASALLERGDYDQAHDFLKELSGQLAAGGRTFCENSIVNAVVNAKYNQAAAAGIECFVNMDLGKFQALDDVSLCTVFANLLDNAIEAAAAIPEGGDRRLWLKARNELRYLSLEVENTKQNMVLTQNGRIITSKTDRGKHGFGLKSVRSIVERFGGTMDVSYTEDRFQVVILIKNR